MKIIQNKKSLEIKFCNNILNRFKGFMFTKKIDKCLCFPKCNSVHTFFMIKPIDIIMTDKNYKILYIFKNVKPYKIILPKKNVYYTFEIPINYFNFKIDNKLRVE